MHVNCELDRFVDTRLCEMRDNHSRVFHYFPRDRPLATLDATRADETIQARYPIDFGQSVPYISCTET